MFTVTPGDKDFVKRVIATGGQTVTCCDPGNRVLVDNEPLDEPYVYFLPEAGRNLQEGFGPVVVPAGQLWMMGDSRNNSSDSRAMGYGPVPIDNVIGQAHSILLPLGRLSSIDMINPQAQAFGRETGSRDGGTAVLVSLLIGGSAILTVAAARIAISQKSPRWVITATPLATLFVFVVIFFMFMGTISDDKQLIVLERIDVGPSPFAPPTGPLAPVTPPG